jgi:hypothetical protein
VKSLPVISAAGDKRLDVASLRLVAGGSGCG